MLKNIQIQTKYRDVVSLTEIVKKTVIESNVENGTCLIYSPHTTAGLTVTSFWDANGLEDIQDEICRLVPTRIDFKHQHDTPQDAAGHIKSVLVGVTLSFIISKKEIILGHSQGIYFLEFDGPRNREVFVKITSDSSIE